MPGSEFCPEHRQSLGGVIGKRSEKNRIEDAEDGGVRADAQRECEHGNACEAGILYQAANGVSEVLTKPACQGSINGRAGHTALIWRLFAGAAPAWGSGLPGADDYLPRARCDPGASNYDEPSRHALPSALACVNRQTAPLGDGHSTPRWTLTPSSSLPISTKANRATARS